MNKTCDPQFTNVKVAVIQATPVVNDKEGALKKAVSLAREAADEGAKILLFPESYLPGYPQDLDFDSCLDLDTDQIRERFKRFSDQAVREPKSELKPLADVAAETESFIIIGMTELKDTELYCTVVIFGPDGKYIGKHRKLRPSGFERLVWSKGEGTNLTVVPTEYGCLGTAICWESYMPLLRAALYAKGTNIYIAPAADSSSHWQCTLQHIALEGRCFVLSCNHYFPYMCDSSEGRPKYNGGSAIIDPRGDYLAGPLYGQEGILYAELDLEKCQEMRYDFDPVSPYTRSDFLKMSGFN